MMMKSGVDKTADNKKNESAKALKVDDCNCGGDNEKTVEALDKNKNGVNYDEKNKTSVLEISSAGNEKNKNGVDETADYKTESAEALVEYVDDDCNCGGGDKKNVEEQHA